jgi:ketosteroid isomerase-like protein
MIGLLLTVLLAVTVQDTDTRTLLRLEDEWASALVKRDSIVFTRLLAPGFVYTENDQTMDRAAVLHAVVAGSDTITAAHNEDMRVHRYGPVTAVVTGWLIVRGRNAGREFERRYRFTDTWVKRGGRWQIVAAQDYVAP